MGEGCNHCCVIHTGVHQEQGSRWQGLFQMLDEETQALARQAGLEVMHPRRSCVIA